MARNCKRFTSVIGSSVLLHTERSARNSIHRSSEATKTIKAASDLTNQLLEANAENLKLGNAEARAQMERGVFDIESIKKANQSLIDTIEESLKIADEGKQYRKNALIELGTCELELKKTLSSASANKI